MPRLMLLAIAGINKSENNETTEREGLIIAFEAYISLPISAPALHTCRQDDHRSRRLSGIPNVVEPRKRDARNTRYPTTMTR